mmetsp:Transcript_89534/g.253664  ORF Transcript_89534/g.253664 Transcript_89534/m.253664 type:complete len:419 (-) Transcript_89534:380-1636(-)
MVFHLLIADNYNHDDLVNNCNHAALPDTMRNVPQRLAGGLRLAQAQLRRLLGVPVSDACQRGEVRQLLLPPRKGLAQRLRDPQRRLQGVPALPRAHHDPRPAVQGLLHRGPQRLGRRMRLALEELRRLLALPEHKPSQRAGLCQLLHGPPQRSRLGLHHWQRQLQRLLAMSPEHYAHRQVHELLRQRHPQERVGQRLWLAPEDVRRLQRVQYGEPCRELLGLLHRLALAQELQLQGLQRLRPVPDIDRGGRHSALRVVLRGPALRLEGRLQAPAREVRRLCGLPAEADHGRHCALPQVLRAAAERLGRGLHAGPRLLWRLLPLPVRLRQRPEALPRVLRGCGRRLGRRLRPDQLHGLQRVRVQRRHPGARAALPELLPVDELGDGLQLARVRVLGLRSLQAEERHAPRWLDGPDEPAL